MPPSGREFRYMVVIPATVSGALAERRCVLAEDPSTYPEKRGTSGVVQ